MVLPGLIRREKRKGGGREQRVRAQIYMLHVHTGREEVFGRYPGSSSSLLNWAGSTKRITVINLG